MDTPRRASFTRYSAGAVQPVPLIVAAGIAIAVRPVTRSSKRHVTPPKSEYTRVTRTSAEHCPPKRNVVGVEVGRSKISRDANGAARDRPSTVIDTLFVRLKSPVPTETV